MFARIQSARERLRGQAHRTPVLTSAALNARCGAEIFFKCENFQRAGAFKFRGAFNALAQIPPGDKARGVLTYSSGNHGQAVALAGRLLGIATMVVMPADASAAKRAATEEYGARVVVYDPQTERREEVAQKLLAREGSILIPPFDHLEVIAGQGTAALELFEETGLLDLLLVPCGGGGLLSGCAVAMKQGHGARRVIGVEPLQADDATRSFRTGQLQTIDHPQTIADGTRTTSLGTLTFPLILRYVDAMETVTEEAIVEAVRYLFYRLKLVVEPSGALGLAALLSGVVKTSGRAGVILSGGNIDGKTIAAIFGGE